jgi:3-hydroxyacyl-CoA dehydrogenase
MNVMLSDPRNTPLLFAYFQEACLTFLLGSNPWEVDEAMVDFGFEQGPFEVQDHIGLDLVYAHVDWRSLDYNAEPWALIPKRIFELGKLGKKAGAGWYRYPGSGGKVEDPIVADLALEEAYFAKLDRADFDKEVIKSRILKAIDLKGARLKTVGWFTSTGEAQNQLRAFGFPDHQLEHLSFLT